MLQIRTVIVDALRIDDEVNDFLKYCDNHGKIVEKLTAVMKKTRINSLSFLFSKKGGYIDYENNKKSARL